MTLSARFSNIGHVDRIHSATRRSTAVSGASHCCHGKCGATVSWARFCQNHCLYIHCRFGLPWRVHRHGNHSCGTADKNGILARSVLCVNRLSNVVHVEFGAGTVLKQEIIVCETLHVATAGEVCPL
jgi:hypothetical protein